MTWSISIFIAAAMSALSVSALKLSGNKVSLLPSLTVYLGAAFLTVFIACLFMQETNFKTLHLHKPAIFCLIMAGIGAALNELFFLQSLHWGMPVGTGKLVYGTASVIFLLFIGFILFNEILDWQKILGVILSFAGLYFLLKP